MNIKIVRRPSGEAPEWVRDAWIGLSLPAASKRQRDWRSLGVLTGPHGWLFRLGAVIFGKSTKVTGYLVNARTAVECLAEGSPNAAAWWHERTPHLLNGRRYFVFDAAACEHES
jgi:hypothetical protein